MDTRTRILIGLAISMGIIMIGGMILLLSTYTPPAHQSQIDPREFAVQEAKAAVLVQAHRNATQSNSFGSSSSDSASWSTSKGDDSYRTGSAEGDFWELAKILYSFTPDQSEFVFTLTVPITTFQSEGGQ